MATSLITVGCQTHSPDNEGANPSVFTTGHHSATELIEREVNTGSRPRNATKVAEIRTQMAAEYLKSYQLDDAKRQLDKAFAADNTYAPAYNMMGMLLQYEGSANNLIKAETFYRKAIAIDPSFMQAHNNYGVYLSRTGRDEQALEHFKIAATALGYSGRMGALENLGLTAAKLGDEVLAQQALSKALANGQPLSKTAQIELIELLINQDKIQQAQTLYNTMLRHQSPLTNKTAVNTLNNDNAVNTNNTINKDNTYNIDKIEGTDDSDSARILWQGIRLAHAQQDLVKQQKLSQKLIAEFPLSKEANLLKFWNRNPEASWK